MTRVDIVDAQCVGVPDDKYGEELCAWAILLPGATLTADEVGRFCRDHIAHYKIPRHILFVDGFSITVGGKVQKVRDARTDAASAQGREPVDNGGHLNCQQRSARLGRRHI